MQFYHSRQFLIRSNKQKWPLFAGASKVFSSVYTEASAQEDMFDLEFSMFTTHKSWLFVIGNSRKDLCVTLISKSLK